MLMLPLRPLFLDRSGTSTVELAIIVPILAVLTFVAADMAMAFKTKIKLQSAAERTAAMATSGGLNSAAYQNLAADAAAGAGVSMSNVTVSSSLLCDGTVQSSTSEVCSSGQQMKRYVNINIAQNYVPMFAKLMPGTSWASGDGISLTGSSSVRLQ